MRAQCVLSVNAWLLTFPRLLFLFVGNVGDITDTVMSL